MGRAKHIHDCIHVLAIELFHAFAGHRVEGLWVAHAGRVKVHGRALLVLSTRRTSSTLACGRARVRSGHRRRLVFFFGLSIGRPSRSDSTNQIRHVEEAFSSETGGLVQSCLLRRHVCRFLLNLRLESLAAPRLQSRWLELHSDRGLSVILRVGPEKGVLMAKSASWDICDAFWGCTCRVSE